jgi:adenosylcobalamin-dependent ribonucleoside-triphosphate reductase
MNLNKVAEPNWGPNGKDVYERTYQRVNEDGSKESWHDTVSRVVRGNLALVPEDRNWSGEEEELYDLFYNFRALPGGRHLWMSGVKGRQFLFNCYVSGWGNNFSDHFAFTFNQLMEGGGVGANYSMKYLNDYKILTHVSVKFVCSPDHPDYQDLVNAGLVNPEEKFDDTYLVGDSREEWVAALRWMVDISTRFYLEPMQLVIDLSSIRASGLPIKTFGGTSAGPVPFARMMKEISHLLIEGYESGVNGPLVMEMDHAISNCVVSGNVRRSARMSQMHWKDPYIDWFLSCKQGGKEFWSTNISVEIDDEFIELLDQHRAGLIGYEIENAVRIWDAIIVGMHENGEPGFWNSSLANKGEPNEVIATNPCGEICLEAWENCNLGHVNLAAFVNSSGAVDFDSLVRAHVLITRFLIRATFGDISDAKTQEVVARNRRIGVGHFGYANFVAKQGIRYSDSYRDDKIKYIISYMADIVDQTAYFYAHELRIPVPVKKRTIAPTGTISKLAGVTESIQAPFALYYIQRIRYSSIDPDQMKKIQDFEMKGYNVIPDPQVANTVIVEIPTINHLVTELEALGFNPDSYLQDASMVSINDQLGVQDMYQTLWADNAVSYTVNFDPHTNNIAVIEEALYKRIGSLKGTTLFPERGFELPPYSRVGKEKILALRGSQAVYGDGVDESCATGACPVR